MQVKSGKPCGPCMGIIVSISTGDFRRTEKFDWHQTTNELIESTKTCQLCAAVWELLLEPWLIAVKERFKDVNYQDLAISLQVSDATSTNDTPGISWATLNTTLAIEQHAFQYPSDGNIGVSIESSNGQFDHQHPQFWVSGQTNSGLTIAEDRILCAKAWLEACENAPHQACQPSQEQLHVPTRLIDLNHGEQFRLVDTSNLSHPVQGLRYATLSHCWGHQVGLGPLKTTKATLSTLSQAIPKDSLPKTFRDAIRIACSLDIPYIWIDSLCIVQDDPDEWQGEAAQMKNIYAGSTLTIAASDGRDSYWGCFPSDEGGIEIVEDGSSTTRRFSEKHGSVSNTSKVDVRAFSFDMCVDKSVGPRKNAMIRLERLAPHRARRGAHLSTRGWVLQEQILSRRTIHCMDNEIHWQCRCLYQTQSGQKYHGDGSEYGFDLRQKANAPTALRMWPKWVEDYSRRDFTISTDRVPAYAGITKYYQSIMGQEPLLGIRQGSLARDLSWLRAGSERGTLGVQLPSWTWLSCNAPLLIDHWGFEKEKDENVEDHTFPVAFHVNWTGPSMTSSLRSTKLIVQGAIKKLSLRVAPEAKDYNPPYFLVDSQETDFSEHPIPWNCSGQFDKEPRFGDPRISYTCLLLRSSRSKSAESYRETFLLLEESGENPNIPHTCANGYLRFRRVGIAMIRGSEPTFFDAEKLILELL